MQSSDPDKTKISIVIICDLKHRTIEYWKTTNIDWNTIDENQMFSDYVHQQIAKPSTSWEHLESNDEQEWFQKPSVIIQSWSENEKIVVLEEYEEPDWSSFATFQNHPNIESFMEHHPHIVALVEQHMMESMHQFLHLFPMVVTEIVEDYLVGGVFDYFYHALNRSPLEFYSNVASLLELLTTFHSHPDSLSLLQFLTEDERQADFIHQQKWNQGANGTMWSLWLQKMDFLFQGIMWKY